nr:MAG TPA: hypothetical protein [Caudoviricetes sp.]
MYIKHYFLIAFYQYERHYRTLMLYIGSYF